VEYDFGDRPTARDVAVRLAILGYVVTHAMAAPPEDARAGLLHGRSESEVADIKSAFMAAADKFWGPVRAGPLWRCLTPWEQEFAGQGFDMDPQDQINGIWRAQALDVLLWALGITDAINAYDVEASPDVLKLIPADLLSRDPVRLQLRPATPLERERNVAELWHWRSRTRQLQVEGYPFQGNRDLDKMGIRGYPDLIRQTAEMARDNGDIPRVIDGDFPAFGKPYRALTPEEWSIVTSITIERHFALNWLCGYAPGNRWDETPTDT